MLESLQGFTGWDDTNIEKSVVFYFPEIDESIRRVLTESGETSICSKQKVSTADFVGLNLPFDFRLAVNIEIDLTRVTNDAGAVEFQVELELLNLPTIQLTCANSQQLCVEIQTRLVDLMNSCEPIRAFQVSLLRKRQF